MTAQELRQLVRRFDLKDLGVVACGLRDDELRQLAADFPQLRLRPTPRT